MAKPRINEYNVNVVPDPVTCSFGHSMIQDVLLLFVSRLSIVFAYSSTGNIIKADAVHATHVTQRDTKGDRYLGDEMGWHTAMYRSADMIIRKIDEVNCVMDVLTMYALHIVLPKFHCPSDIVATRNGIPIRKHSSAIAKFNRYMFVTVFIF